MTTEKSYRSGKSRSRFTQPTSPAKGLFFLEVRMSLLTQMVLIEKYGLRVDLDRVAEILETTPPNIRRKISDNTFQIPTYIDGGKRWADIRDVAEYLDQRRQEARLVHGANLPASVGRSGANCSNSCAH